MPKLNGQPWGTYVGEADTLAVAEHRQELKRAGERIRALEDELHGTGSGLVDRVAALEGDCAGDRLRACDRRVSDLEARMPVSRSDQPGEEPEQVGPMPQGELMQVASRHIEQAETLLGKAACSPTDSRQQEFYILRARAHADTAVAQMALCRAIWR